MRVSALWRIIRKFTALTSGTRLGPYEIAAPLGAGGMGEVYKARDTRLDRTVAIKVLPPHLADTPEARQRFEREARAVSSLNHPHICTLYDVGSEGGIDFLVMEYLEGETLAARIEKGPLPTGDVLRFGMEIADALDKAHRGGVIHRDLKPGNIMLTKSGTKLLDFGLAKAGPTAVPISGATLLTTAPTASSPITAVGTVAGTFQYMSPEQIEGLDADGRSDIFAFGAVVYEMATGKRAFEGKTQTSVIAAVLASGPPAISSVQPGSPPGLDRVVKFCLMKDRDERIQSAHDVRLELQWVAEGGSQNGAAATVIAPRGGEIWAWRIAAIFLAAVAGLAGAGYVMRTPQPGRAIVSTLLPPESAKEGTTSGALSPDGTKIAFREVAAGNTPSAMWIRSLDTLEAKRFPAADQGAGASWSPDGRWLLFFDRTELKKASVAGGPAISLAEVQTNNQSPATWNDDGVILFVNRSGEIYQIPERGGEAKQVTHLDASRHEMRHQYPQFFPGGRNFIYTAASPSQDATSTRSELFAIFAASLDGKVKKYLCDADSKALYGSGYLLFVRENTLMAQPFDAGRLVLSGEAMPIVPGVEAGPMGQANFSVSTNGVLTYREGTGQTTSRLTLVNMKSGESAGELGEEGFLRSVRVSPDGKSVVVGISSGVRTDPHLWIYDVARGLRTPLTPGTVGIEADAVWSADGKSIAFLRAGTSESGMYLSHADGTGSEELLHSWKPREDSWIPTDWSPDGRFLLIQRNAGGASGFRTGIWAMPISGDRTPVPVVQGPYSARSGRFSPDGRWMAFDANVTGQFEVYVAPFPGPGPQVRVSINGGTEPAWLPGGRGLLWATQGQTRQIMMADIRVIGAKVEAGSPRAVSVPAGLELVGRPEIMPDGQRLLLNLRAVRQQAPPITLVEDWPALVKK